MSTTVIEPIEVGAAAVEQPAEPVEPILLRAAAIMRRRGHGKKKLRVKSGEVCAIGAISLVRLRGDGEEVAAPPTVPRTGRRLGAIVALARSLGWSPDALEREGRDVPAEEFVWRWNDADERTESDVLEALERAAYGL